MLNRRDFLGCSAAAIATLITPGVFARSARADERELAFYNIHTDERLNTTYWANGQYIPEELQAINKLLRDHRNGATVQMDRKLLDLLYAVQNSVDKYNSFEVISAYRSISSNASLRKAGAGVAKNSLHMKGRAIDIRLPGVELKQLRQAALNLRAGGVGYYPRSNFIHLDTGRPRFW